MWIRKYPLTWGDACAKVAPYRTAQRRPGPGSRVRRDPTCGLGRRGPRSGPRFGTASASGDGAGTNTTDPPREAARFAGWTSAVDGPMRNGESPQLARRSHGPRGAGSVPRTCPGQRDSVVTATGRATGDRADNAASPAEPSGTTGDVRSSERLTPAGRPSVDGSPLQSCPGRRSGSGRRPPGAVRFFTRSRRSGGHVTGTGCFVQAPRARGTRVLIRVSQCRISGLPVLR